MYTCRINRNNVYDLAGTTFDQSGILDVELGLIFLLTVGVISK